LRENQVQRLQTPSPCWKAVDDYRSPRRSRDCVVGPHVRQVLDCASPLALWSRIRAARSKRLNILTLLRPGTAALRRSVQSHTNAQEAPWRRRERNGIPHL
jgi:hypothetical protein